jgi:hypothetical protein
VTSRRLGKLIDLEREEMMWDEIAQALEPETGQLRQHLAFIRDA